jgi:hypothetical protein
MTGRSRRALVDDHGARERRLVSHGIIHVTVACDSRRVPADRRRTQARRSMTLLAATAFLIALVAAGSADAARIRAGFFRLTPVKSEANDGSLVFTVDVRHVASNDRPTLAWSLAPRGGAACENAGFVGGTRSRNGLVVWDQQGPTFRWTFGAGRRCAGTVSVVAENQYEHCTAKVAVVGTAAHSALPACALGGYAVGFSTLPVPAGVFHAYDRIRAELSGPPRSAAADAKRIRTALHVQAASFALFPPLWFCNFRRTLTPIVALRSDLAQGSTAARRDARTAAHALASCAPATVRTAFERLAASSKPNPAALATTLEHDFPPIFGFRYDDLVNRVAAEEAALTSAERAASAGRSEAAARRISAADLTSRGINAALNHYERHVSRVENAHG